MERVTTAAWTVVKRWNDYASADQHEMDELEAALVAREKNHTP